MFAAIQRMEELRVGCIVVIDDDKVCGIVTARDYLRQIAIKGRSSRTTNVGEIMSYPVVCAHIEDTVERCMAVMTEKRCRHLPIVGPTGLAGLVSIGDLVKRIASAQKMNSDGCMTTSRASTQGSLPLVLRKTKRDDLSWEAAAADGERDVLPPAVHVSASVPARFCTRRRTILTRHSTTPWVRACGVSASLRLCDVSLTCASCRNTRAPSRNGRSWSTSGRAGSRPCWTVASDRQARVLSAADVNG